jgi:hypothetical protein
MHRHIGTAGSLGLARVAVKERVWPGSRAITLVKTAIHSYVDRANPGASLTAIQAETLELVRALADEGLPASVISPDPAVASSHGAHLWRTRCNGYASRRGESQRQRQLALVLLAGPHR